MAMIVAPAGRAEHFSADPEHGQTLPAHYYFDKDIYAREQEEIWFKPWQFAGFTSDLGNPGDYISDFIIDQPVFVVRTKDGTLRAFYNVCTHRGHILVEGKGNKNILTCPFHAWSFDTTGKLKTAGNAENVAGFRLEDFGLPGIRVEEMANMVFVNLDEDAAPLSEVAAGLEADLRAKIPRFDDLKLARRDDYYMDFNWKFVMDQNEYYHCRHGRIPAGLLHTDLLGVGIALAPIQDLVAGVEERALFTVVALENARRFVAILVADRLEPQLGWLHHVGIGRDDVGEGLG
jgi:phenylpropionate dioxygenase-like ring-hydroxylating dioxygenase large terminal subunit